MVRLPGWMTMQIRMVNKQSAHFTVRVRCWHPGFWLWALRTILRGQA